MGKCIGEKNIFFFRFYLFMLVASILYFMAMYLILGLPTHNNPSRFPLCPYPAYI